MCGDTICGGYPGLTTGLTLSDSAHFFYTNITLHNDRRYHSCLQTEQGVLLMGDRYNPTTTELVKPDGTTLISFDLKYNVG